MVKFLVIRFSSIGDIILTTPVVRLLKQQIENSVVHFLTKPQYGSMLKTNPNIDKLHLLSANINETVAQLKAEEFDYIIDLHHNLRTAMIKNRLKIIAFSVNKINIQKWLLVNLRVNRMPEKHMVDRNLETIRLFDVSDDGKGLDYFIPPDEETEPSALGKEFGSGYIALAIGAQHETKKMPVEKLSAMLAMIDHPVVILGGPGDREAGEAITGALPGRSVINNCGMFSINQSASLVRQARLIITHDTGMMHIAAAFRKKILSLWGSTDPVFGMYPYHPDPDSVIFEVKGLRCRPCSKIGYSKCPKGHFDCMMKQDIERIAGTANQLFTVQ